jgi:hypothetical protein
LALNFLSEKKGEPADGGAWAAFISGVLFTNALAHFTHGISGEDFAAPFGYLLGPGLPSNLSNVVWGFFNIVMGYVQFGRGKVFQQDTRRTFAFFAGVLAMGIFLSVVFSR